MGIQAINYRALAGRGYLIPAALIAVLLASAWWYFTPSPKPVGEATVAKQAPQLRMMPTMTIKPPSVSVFVPAAKKKLSLPAAVQNDDKQYVLSSSRVASNLNPQTVTTVIDERSGKSETYVTREALPWFAFEQTGEARIDYGWKNARSIARLSVREDLVQVKALHLGFNAALDSDGEHFVGVGIGWRW